MANEDNRIKRLTTTLEQQIVEADSRSSEQGVQRERNHRNYTLGPLGNEMPGRSRYIDPAVFDVTESKKSYFRETFFSGRRPVKFLPGDNEAPQVADMKTAYVKRQLDKADWYRLACDGWHDAMVAKRCVYHVEWFDDYDTIVMEADGASPQQLMWQLQQIPDVMQPDMSEMQQGQDGSISGTMRVFTDASRVKITLVQPERYYRDPLVSYPADAAYCCYEEDLTRAELIDRGYDEDQVLTLKQDYRWRRDHEDTARRSHDGSWTRQRNYNRDEDTETVTVFTTYTWMNLAEHVDGYPDEVRLWKIIWCQGEVLRDANDELAITEMSEMPFFEWSQYKISHAESGMCDADVLAPLQRQQSTLKRLIIDNQQMANTSRWQVQVGGVKNLRSLLDTTIGGVVEVTRPDALAPLPPPQLSPLTMQAVEMLEQDKEARSGSSRLAKGLNQQAVQNQNADSMIERLTNSSNRRVMNECRDYAESLLVPLMKYIYVLGVRHDKRLYTLEAGGMRQQQSPQQWAEPAPNCEVAVALTPEEGAKRAMSLMQMHQMLAMDPVVGQLYGVAQRHALMEQMFEALGIQDASPYMIVPGSPEHQQMMQQQQQAMMAQQQQQQQIIALQLRHAQLQAQLMQSADQREWQKFSVEAADTATDNLREDDKLDLERFVDTEKLDIERMKARKSAA